MRRQILILDRG